jgi:hypothetical protein
MHGFMNIKFVVINVIKECFNFLCNENQQKAHIYSILIPDSADRAQDVNKYQPEQSVVVDRWEWSASRPDRFDPVKEHAVTVE